MPIFSLPFFHKKDKHTFEKHTGRKRDNKFPITSWGSKNVYPIDIQNPTVTAAINLIASSIAKLPLNLYFKKNDDSRIRATWDYRFNLLKYKPNKEEPPIVFKFRLLKYLLTHGNAYIRLAKDVTGNITELIFMEPSSVKVERNDESEKIFTYNGIQYTEYDVLHIFSNDYDGLVGHSPLESAKYAVQLGNTLDRFAENSIANGINTKGYVDTSDSIDVELDANDVTERINNKNRYYFNHFSGIENAGKLFVAMPGDKISPLDLSSNRDAQLYESREFQVREISKIFNVPIGLLVGEDVYSNIEKVNQTFLSNCLDAWIDLVQQSFNKLLTEYESQRYYFEFDTSSIVTMTLQEQFSAYEVGIRSGQISIDEARKSMNRPDLEGDLTGTTHFYPANTIPLTDDNIKATLAQSKLALQETNHNKSGYGDASL